MFKLRLVDTNENVCRELRKLFPKDVEVIDGKFEDVKVYDCLIAAGNSFGLMDGGIDLAIKNYFGEELEKDVQDIILERHLVELQVGECEIIFTYNDDHPYLAYAPTMRLPIDISKTDNVYKAMLAALISIYKFNKETNEIDIVLCSGLGTCTGKMPAKIAAKQMFAAYKHFIDSRNIIGKTISWGYAHKIHQDVLKSFIDEEDPYNEEK